jgi:hypothetical protein
MLSALFMGTGKGVLCVQNLSALPSVAFRAGDMRINDADSALGCNSGSLEVCFAD